jgi:hypothetical protein
MRVEHQSACRLSDSVAESEMWGRIAATVDRRNGKEAEA